MVFKLVELDGQPRIKLSDDKGKVLIPGKKKVYRIHVDGHPAFDLITAYDEAPPSGEVTGHSISNDEDTVTVTASEVECLTADLYSDGATVFPSH